TDAVLGAQALLLLEADRVVRLLAAAGAPVLTGTVRALLEVLDGLGGQGDAQSAGEPHLTARARDCHSCGASCRRSVTPSRLGTARRGVDPLARTPGGHRGARDRRLGNPTMLAAGPSHRRRESPGCARVVL